MNHYEIINPSDKVIVSGEDDMIAAVAVLFLGEGRYGLRRIDNDDRVLPIFLMGGAEEWLQAHGIPDIGKYLKEHAIELALVFESAFYGSASELREFDASMAGIPSDAASRARATYNDIKRSSLNNIGAACLAYAGRLREIAVQPKET